MYGSTENCFRVHSQILFNDVICRELTLNTIGDICTFFINIWFTAQQRYFTILTTKCTRIKVKDAELHAFADRWHHPLMRCIHMRENKCIDEHKDMFILDYVPEIETHMWKGNYGKEYASCNRCGLMVMTHDLCPGL